MSDGDIHIQHDDCNLNDVLEEGFDTSLDFFEL